MNECTKRCKYDILTHTDLTYVHSTCSASNLYDFTKHHQVQITQRKTDIIQNDWVIQYMHPLIYTLITYIYSATRLRGQLRKSRLPRQVWEPGLVSCPLDLRTQRIRTWPIWPSPCLRTRHRITYAASDWMSSQIHGTPRLRQLRGCQRSNDHPASIQRHA